MDQSLLEAVRKQPPHGWGWRLRRAPADLPITITISVLFVVTVGLVVAAFAIGGPPWGRTGERAGGLWGFLWGAASVSAILLTLCLATLGQLVISIRDEWEAARLTLRGRETSVSEALRHLQERMDRLETDARWQGLCSAVGLMAEVRENPEGASILGIDLQAAEAKVSAVAEQIGMTLEQAADRWDHRRYASADW